MKSATAWLLEQTPVIQRWKDQRMNARLNPAYHDVEVDFSFTDTLIVECRWTKPIPASHSQPAEGGNEVRSVMWRGLDITKLLTPSEFADIEDKANEPR